MDVKTEVLATVRWHFVICLVMYLFMLFDTGGWPKTERVVEELPWPEKREGCEGVVYQKRDFMFQEPLCGEKWVKMYFDDFMEQNDVRCILDRWRGIPREVWDWGMESEFQARATLLWYTQLHEYALHEKALAELRKLKYDGAFPEWWGRVWTQHMGGWDCHGCK